MIPRTLAVALLVFGELMLLRVPAAVGQTVLILSGTWTGKEADGSSAGQLVFDDCHRLKIVDENMVMSGTYTIDFSVMPNVLEFTLDGSPGKKAYAVIEFKGGRELRMTHLSESRLSDWSRQDNVTFEQDKKPPLDPPARQ